MIRDGKVIGERSETTRRRHNERLPGLVSGVLAECGVEPVRIEAIAVSIGPGSFTGLRVGLSFAKGMALGLGVPIVPVGSLEALAAALAGKIAPPGEELSEGDLLCPMTVARRGESFAQLFIVTDGVLVRRGEPFLTDGSGIASRSDAPVWSGGEGADALAESIARFPDGVRYVPGVSASAGTVGLIGDGFRRDASHSLKSIGELEPVYIKEFTVKRRIQREGRSMSAFREDHSARG